MDFDLTPEQEEIRKLAHDFADREIAPGARERDRGEIFPHDILRKMAPVGFLGGPVFRTNNATRFTGTKGNRA